jgi:ankyrin repeat protein
MKPLKWFLLACLVLLGCFTIRRVDQTAKNVGLLTGAAAGDLRKCQALIRQGADISYSDLGWTALHWAAASGNIDLCSFLIDRGISLNAQTEWGEEWVVLSPGAIPGSLSKVRQRIHAESWDSPPGWDREGGFTPIMVAAVTKQKAVWRVLKARGADPQLSDFHHRNAYQLAAKYGWSVRD